MRPTLQHDDTGEETDRIIYLGDVRRRRARHRRGPDRHYLGALSLVAALAWAGWLAVLFTLPPARLLTFTAFFLPLWLALTATGSIAAYAVEWRRGTLPGLRACTAHGIALATFIVLNLALQAAHRWTLLFAAISLLAAVAADLVLVWRSTY